MAVITACTEEATLHRYIQLTAVRARLKPHVQLALRFILLKSKLFASTLYP